MNIRTIFSAVALSIVAVSSTVTAQTYTLGYDQTLYTATAGSTVSAQLILTEEITGSQVARLSAGVDGMGDPLNDGLFAFSSGTDFSVFTGGANGSVFNGTVIFNPDLMGAGTLQTGQFITTGPGNVSLEGQEDFGADTDMEVGVNGVMVTPTRYELLLATIEFDAGDVGTLTTLQLGDHINPSGPPFLFGEGATPPINLVNSQILVVVPEPGSLAFVTLLAGAGLLRRRRK